MTTTAPRLRVPIGLGPDGAPVELDLTEPAHGGMGPHGLIVGATGSGRPELLRTLVVALAAGHDPATLNFVLVDVAGGTTFATLDRLPHTGALITDLADEPPLVDRMRDAVNGELTRRQELLRRSGNFASVRDYARVRAAGAALNPLPSLLIVCDGCPELLAARPDLVDLFARIGAVGRSLGVHLLLAGQRVGEGWPPGLDAHLSYRIDLRPRHGSIAFGDEPPVRFRTAVDPSGPAPLDVLVGRMRGSGTPAHRVWLPPLRAAPGLDDLLGSLIRVPGDGITVADAELRGRLVARVGIVDRPLHHRRDLLRLDLAGAAGNVLVVGGPQSGKSTLLRTLILSLAVTHTARDVQFYCLDQGAGTLTLLRDLPHVGGVATRRDPGRVRRTVAELGALLRRRDEAFAAGGVDSMATYRRLRAEGRYADDPYGDVFLVVDGWTEFADRDAVIVDLAERGLRVGIHVVATAGRWTDVRHPVRDAFGTRLELRLDDPAGSTVNPRAAADVPENAPGRGLTADGAHFLAARPRFEGTGDGTGSLVRVVADIRTAWDGPLASCVVTRVRRSGG